MDLLDLPAWFDQLPDTAQNQLTEASKRFRCSGSLLPAAQGAALPEQLDYGTRLFLSQRGPFSLIRIGDCELSLLASGFCYKEWAPLDTQLWHCGLSRKGLAFRRQLREAWARADMVGLQQNWLPVREKTELIMRMAGLPVPAPNGVEVHLPYHLLISGALFKYLENKRVLLIGALADTLARAWVTGEFVRRYSCWGLSETTKIAGAVNTPGRGEDCWQAIDEILAQTAKSPFDVALVAAGAPAKVLAVRIARQLQRTALDIGYVFDALLDASPEERASRPILGAVEWPA